MSYRQQEEDARERQYEEAQAIVECAQAAYTNIAYFIAKEMHDCGMTIGADALEGVMQYVVEIGFWDDRDAFDADRFLSDAEGTGAIPSDAEGLCRRAIAEAKKPKAASIDDSLSKLAIAQNELNSIAAKEQPTKQQEAL